MKGFGLKSSLALIAILIFAVAIYLSKLKSNQVIQTKTKPPISTSQEDSPKIVSTKPDPLEEAVIGAADTIEISFNRSLENEGEFKVRIDPKVDFKIQLSSDRKTAKIMPQKPYELGVTYTLFIGTETKFDGVGRWGEEKIFHFQTVRYRGV